MITYANRLKRERRKKVILAVCGPMLGYVLGAWFLMLLLGALSQAHHLNLPSLAIGFDTSLLLYAIVGIIVPHSRTSS